MNRTYMIMAGIAVVSLAAGGAGGYLIADKRLRAEYDERTRKDVAQIKDFYKKLHKADEYATPASAAEVLIPEEERSEFAAPETPLVSEAVEALKSYSPSQESDVSKDDEKTTKAEIRNVFVNGRPFSEWNYELEVARRTEDRPYIITQEEYFEAVLDFPQQTITYYEGDDTLVDSLDEPIMDHNSTVGDENLLRFGHGSNDNNIVYVRNHALEIDFEVIRSRGKYAQEVLGFREPPERKGLAKMRRGDDG